MKAYTLCLLALAALSSARPNPSGGEDGESGQGQGHHPSEIKNQENYEKAKHTHSTNGGHHGGGDHPGSPATTAFPTLNPVTGGYGGANTAGYAGAATGGNQPPAPTSSTVKGDRGSQSFGSGPSGVAGSGPVSSGTSSAGNTTTGGTISKGKITLPAGCQSVNGIGFGWLPDYNGASLAKDESAVGNKNPCFAGYYGQTGLPGWNDGAQITDNIADATSGGKPYPIFVASVMPQGTSFDQITEGSAVVTSIANAMTKLTAAGLTVFLRFAHEMNYYDGSGIYTGSAEEFSSAWGAVSTAVKDIPGVYMHWSPNSDSAADLVSSGWYPAQGTVDIIGIDVYPSGGSDFAGIYQDFCQHWPNIPFVIGETGSKGGGSTSDKHAWLQQLTSTAALQACPNYLGFSWFEYLKGVDFRIATGGNTAYEGIL